MDEIITTSPAAATDKVGEYFAPVDPMDAFQCESCQ